MKNQSLTALSRLTNEFTKLPGVGIKTAQRYAYKIIDMPKSEVAMFCAALNEAKEKITYCKVCGNFTEDSPCDICETRKNENICVVAYPKDVLTMEKIKAFNGQYHVLHGTISPLDGRGPNDIRIKELLSRLASGVKEVVLALNPDVEGEATSMYIASLLKPLGIKATRLAQGISMGTDLEYADELTLSEAYNNRKEI